MTMGFTKCIMGLFLPLIRTQQQKYTRITIVDVKNATIGDTDENDGERKHPFCSLSSYIMRTHIIAPFCARVRL